MHTLADRTPALARAGNFWSRILNPADREMVRHLAHSGFITGLDDSLSEIAKAALGGGYVLRDSVDIPWQPSNVMTLGPDLQERIVVLWSDADLDGVGGWWAVSRPTSFTLGLEDHATIELTLPDSTTIILSSNGCEYYLFPAEGESDGLPVSALDMRTKWLVPIPSNIRPQVLEIPGRFLVAGIDFQWMPGVLVFTENPHALFKDSIVCQSAWVEVPYMFGYAQGVDGLQAPKRAVAHFQQRAQTASTLRAALVELLGRRIADTTRWVTSVQAYCTTRVYQLDDGTSLTIEYPHHEYAVGDVITAGTVIGLGIDTWGPNRDDPNWFAVCPWGDGLPLSVVSPFAAKDLYIPNAPCRFEAYEEVAGKLHVRPWLPGNQDDSHSELERYWAWIKAAEQAQGVYLNDILGLAAEGDDVMINALQFYFENGLSEHALVIYLDPAVISTSDKQRVRKFLEAERLHDTVYILLP